jgi:hypothetical protein
MEVMAMGKQRYKISLAVERLREVETFFEIHRSHRSLSSQERRRIEVIRRELRKALENSNSPFVWVKADLVGDILRVFLKIYKSFGVNDNEN